MHDGRWIAGCLVIAARVACAQATAGVTVGAASLSDSRTERALTAIAQYQPAPWLTLSALPSFVSVADTAGGATVSSTGLGDLPLVAGVAAAVPGAWTPTPGAALILTLPTGNAACGLGTGQVSLGGALGLTVTPAPGVRVTAGASRNLSGLGTQSSLGAAQATWISAGVAWDAAPGWMVDGAVSADVANHDSTQASIGTLDAGASRRLAGPLALTVDVGHGLTSASPRWVVSVGIGTAFSGISPVAPTAPLRRLGNSFSGGVGRSGGPGKTSCR